jgi:putative aldouronate transport system substrate-binding protein
MKMGKSKWLVILCVLAMMMTVFAACGNSSNDKKNEPDKQAASNTNEPAVKEVEKTPEPVKPIAIEIMLPMKEKEIPSDRIEILLEEKTGYDLKFQWVPDGNYDEKMNASFATGTLPQVVYLKNQASFLQYKDAMRDEQFWEIGPYLSEFEGLSRLKDSILTNTKVDGKIYTLYLGRELARQGVIYRKDWADKLNIKEPTNIDEVFAMFQAFTEGDPDGNNKKDTIGLSDRSDLIYGAFKTISSWYNTPNNWGEKDGQLLPEFMFDEYKQTMDYMKKLRDGGYMNKDFPVTSKEDQRNLFYNGSAGAYIGAMTDVKTLNDETKKNFPDAEMEVAGIITGPNGDFGMWAIPGYASLIAFPKSAIKTEEELKQVLGFFDKQMEPEIANLMYWGVEGEHYEVVDGKAKPFGDKSDLIARDVKGFKDSLIGELDTTGRYDSIDALPATVKAKEIIALQDKALILDPAAALDSATMAQDGVRLQQLINDATFKYILGTLDAAGFDAAVADWSKQGGNKIIEEINASWAKSK